MKDAISRMADFQKRFLPARHLSLGAAAAVLIAGLAAACAPRLFGGPDREVARGNVYSVTELDFEGPRQTPEDVPARDVVFWTRFRHESGSPAYRIYGFWDGDGDGGTSGNAFKVRFTPTKPGRWILEEVYSSSEKLDGQKEGAFVTAASSDRPGFWVVDDKSAGRRWYRRSNGSHPYIYGNTHYSFLSGYNEEGESAETNIRTDVRRNAEYFKKLRFGLHGDYYTHPQDKPYFDEEGRPTDEGDYSHRPNPAWFQGRVDVAVETAAAQDMIADLILAGPDTEPARATLRARHNDGDPTPYLKYIAARYGSYPNVWLTLSNEYDIRTPTYSEEEIARFGEIIGRFLPYETPLSVHASGHGRWDKAFDALPDWYDHLIIQRKLRHLAPSADIIKKVRRTTDEDLGPRRKPVINDELSYQGAGDEHDENDTIEAHLGAFLGGGYATTGYKTGSKVGHYFDGGFDPNEHTAADNLRWLRRQIDDRIIFWKMMPDRSIFSNLDEDFRAMAYPEREYVLGTNTARKDITADLPAGTWTVTRFDVIGKEIKTLTRRAEDRFTFDAPPRRAMLFHFQRSTPE